ncbi:hypothetical protein DFH08DRAFT_809168 [Mycena albidolilacea]|uniref:Uncharacterized protein n=1 Tax=Mycena albidolilacea TaxID=1033008 RepID=A0AAD7EQZ7_9AGAR|nr:hypothetical protein DFH08DRAFT_809168 [Mycena albidolilacea]
MVKRTGFDGNFQIWGGASNFAVTVLTLCIHRACCRQHAEELQPKSFFIVNTLVTNTQAPNQSQADSASNSNSNSHTSISTVVLNWQEYLTAQLCTVQKQLEAVQGSVGSGSSHLDQAKQQNNALRARICMLEQEMQSQWGLGLTDSPPAYLDCCTICTFGLIQSTAHNHV